MKIPRISMILMCLLLMTSCSVDPNAGSTSQEPAFSTQFIQLAENMDLNDHEQIKILDTWKNLLLINVYSRLSTDDPNFSEEGYNSITHQLIIYDFLSDAIVKTHTIKEGYCSDGLLFENEIVLVTLSPGFKTDYKISRISNTAESTIVQGNCYADDFDAPHLVRAGDTFVYSYSDSGNPAKTFGINLVSKNNEIIPQLLFTDDGNTEHLRTTISGDGSRYIYLTAINGTSTMIIGNQDGILHQFQLPSSERIYDFALLEETVLFSMEDFSSGSSTKKIMIKNFSGETIAQQDWQIYCRVESNGIDTTCGIDMSYQPYCVQYVDSAIKIHKLDLPNKSVLFHSLSPTQFIAMYKKATSSTEQCILLQIQ